MERRRRTDREGQYRSRAYRGVLRRLAQGVRRERVRQRLSQEEAAHRCGLDVRHFQRIEGGEANITITTVARICAGLGVDVAVLFQRSKPASR